MTASAPVLLAVRDMSIRFGGLVAVSSMTFDVHEGEVLSLIGPNGAGKTSAFNAITGYLSPASGDIVYHGQRPDGQRQDGQRLNGMRPDAVSRLGVVRTFQKTSLFGGMSALDNVLIGLHKRSTQQPLAIMLGLASIGRDERALVARAHEVLAFVGLDERAQEIASALPYGEQRLLEVAIALAAEPRLLLLDEPVSGMNPSEKASFMATIGRIRQLGITILLVEHDMRTVMGASDRVICLNQGHIIADGTPQAIQRNADVIRAYLGERSVRAGG